MTTRDTQPPATVLPITRATRVQLAVTLAVTYVCFFHGLTAFGLVGPDEPRYAAIARDMAAGNDWVTPRLHGEPWLEKPILYYWVAASGYRLFGDGELAARLPSVLGALTTLLALGWVTRRFYGDESARVFGLVFPSSIAILVFARAATPDMLFSSTLALALAAAAPLVLVTRLQHTSTYQVGFGAALGLAVLAKGPAGIVLAGAGSMIGALLTGRLRYVWRLAGPWAVTSFAVVALPWYVLCALRNPEFIQVFLVFHNVERFLTPVFLHPQPFWFFGPVMLLGLAPWTAAIVGTIQRSTAPVTDREWTGSPSVFLAAWVLFPVAFFSLSQSKLPGYVLPAVPAAAVLLSRALALAAKRGSRARALGLGTAAVLGAMTVAFLVAPGVDSSGVEPGAVRPLSGMLGVATIITGYLATRGQLREAVAVSALGVGLTLWQLNASVLPQLDHMISTRVAAQEATDLAKGGPIRAYALDRAWHYGLEYYLGRAVSEWNAADPTGSVIVTTLRGMRAMQLEGAGVVILGRVSPEALLVRIDPDGERLTTR